MKKKINESEMPAHNSHGSMLFDRIIEPHRIENLNGVFFQPKPRAHLKRPGKKNVFWILATELILVIEVEIVPKIAMSCVDFGLGLNFINMMGKGLIEQALDIEHFGQMGEGVARFSEGIPQAISHPKA